MGLDLATAVTGWYDRAARDLPWRAAGVTPWGVLVSEVMLQQTPVARVLPVFQAWQARWPTPGDLAAASPGDAVRRWGKLGYPRRALRLHECARDVVARFGGEVPDDLDALLSLPGIGAYTARAVAVFAFGQRHPVVDTNVRRVLARAVSGVGEAAPSSGSSTGREHAAVEALLPTDPASAARTSIALMELGALVCTARSPRCADCPLAAGCAWRAAGSPAYTGRKARPQSFAGTDRQVRGLLMDVLRSAAEPVRPAALDVLWPDAAQRDRALASLLVDGLVVRLDEGACEGAYALPS